MGEEKKERFSSGRIVAAEGFRTCRTDGKGGSIQGIFL